MTVSGVGIDIVQIDRIRRILVGPGGAGFVEATFTADEIRAVKDRGEDTVHFATRFAIKEAVFKCLRTTFAEGDDLRDIEVRDGAVAAPSVALAGRFADLLAERGATEPTVSVSFEDEYVVAVAVLETHGPPPTRGRPTSPGPES